MADIEAMVDEAVVLEDEGSDMDVDEGSDIDVDAAGNTSHTHQNVPTAIWTITPKNVERRPDLTATLPTNAAITAEKMDTSA